MKSPLNEAIDKLTLIRALRQLDRELCFLGPIPNNVGNKECYSSWSNKSCTLPVPTDFTLYDYAVKFFNIITKFQDTVTLTPDLLADKKSVNALNSRIKNIGRNERGWIRSKPGETITEENIFLGNVFDIPTLTIKQLKELAKQDKSPKGNWVQWVVQIHQLQNFLRCNVDATKKLVISIIVNEECASRGISVPYTNKTKQR